MGKITVLLSALILTSSVYASTKESVEIGQIDVRALSNTTCTKYVDDNDYDGDCLEYNATCSFELIMPSTNPSGTSEIYKIYQLPFLGLDVQDGESCAQAAADWKAEQSRQVLKYTVDKKVHTEIMWLSPSAIGILLRNQPSTTPRTCYRVQHVTGAAHFNGYDKAVPLDGGGNDFDSIDDNLTNSTRLPDKDCAFIDAQQGW